MDLDEKVGVVASVSLAAFGFYIGRLDQIVYPTPLELTDFLKKPLFLTSVIAVGAMLWKDNLAAMKYSCAFYTGCLAGQAIGRMANYYS
ncbi:MAG: hypothetical protein ABIF10_04265 [Candidatus Woesearchaeota archaeon]